MYNIVLSDGANEFFEMVNDRRSVRKYSKKPVDIEIIKKCILAAGTGPCKKTLSYGYFKELLQWILLSKLEHTRNLGVIVWWKIKIQKLASERL